MSARILAVIPALDAGRSVGRVVEGCLTYLPDVVVVNDGSADDTRAVAEKAGARVVDHPKNMGKGAALKSGFRLAIDEGFDAVLSLDADGQHLPAEIPKLLDAFRETGADLVIGDRSRLWGGMVPRRRNANRFSAWAISRCAGVRVPDTQSGFRVYSIDMLRSIPIRADGFAAESEVIVRTGRSGGRIVAVPIELGFVDGLSTSHYRPLLDTIRIAIVVGRTRFLG
jgi:glycosyltransferase involved in cell wall biosynthesis